MCAGRSHTVALLTEGISELGTREENGGSETKFLLCVPAREKVDGTREEGSLEDTEEDTDYDQAMEVFGSSSASTDNTPSGHHDVDVDTRISELRCNDV